jgi:ribosome-associated heat shock protein Hsp15
MMGPGEPAGVTKGMTIRIDKWLFFTRFFKSRSLAANVVEAGAVRLNGQVAAKASQLVKVGDEVIFPAGPRWRRVQVVALGAARRPAPEARLLYEELPPPEGLEPPDRF